MSVQSMNLTELISICVGVAVVYSLIMLHILHRFSDKESRERRGSIASAYMDVVGGLFAILTAFLISGSYTTLENTQGAVYSEVATASQLAYASSALPPWDAQQIQYSLSVYMHTVAEREWPVLKSGNVGESPAATTLSDLQKTIFNFTNRPYVSNTEAQAIANAAQSLTTYRSNWIADRQNGLPATLLVLVVLAGFTLITNAIVVSGRHQRRYAVVAGGVILLVALDVTVVLAMNTPFGGPFGVSPAPITNFVTQLHNGDFLPWVIR